MGEQAGYNSGMFSPINVRDNTKKCHFSCYKSSARTIKWGFKLLYSIEQSLSECAKRN